jgi:hypothetical protein
VRQIDQDLHSELPKIGRLKLRNVLMRIRAKMRGVGKKSSRPVKWDSDKQRAAFFATDGFGRGIPTKRSGAYIRAWQVVQKENGFSLINRKPQAKYIGGNAYGLGQSRIHRGRWKLLKDATEEEIKKLPQEMKDALLVAGRRIAQEAA